MDFYQRVGMEVGRPSSLKARLSCFETSSSAATPREPDLTTAVEGLADASAIDVSLSAKQFTALSEMRKCSLLERIVQAPSSLTSINLDGLCLDNSHAAVLASILRRPTLQELFAERNHLTEDGLLLLADAVIESWSCQSRPRCHVRWEK